MNLQTLYNLRYLNLKTKLCLFTVILIGIVMLFVGYTVIGQQREALFVQMDGIGTFLVKNLARNVVGPLLEQDSLSLSNLVTSLESRDKFQGNPAQLTRQEYDQFLVRFLLQDLPKLLKSYLSVKGDTISIAVDKISAERFDRIGTEVLAKLLNLVRTFTTAQQYRQFLEEHPWAKNLIDPLVIVTDTKFAFRSAEISPELQEELQKTIAKLILNELLTHVKSLFIGYAIIVDKDNIIQAHPDIDKFIGQQYVWPEGATPLKAGEEIKIQRVLFNAEPHYDFAAPVIVRDKNLGIAQVGTVHVGLREEYILKNIRSAKIKIISVTILAIVLGSLGAYGLAVLLVKPVEALVHDAEILGGGDLDHQIAVRSSDEVGALAATLDATRVKLKDAQERLITSERLARELEIAREIQMTLLPKETPQMEHFELGTLYRAASQVGGDLYDFFWVSEDELGIVIADVSGKGIPGSLVMTMTKAVIRAKAVKTDTTSHLLPVGIGGDPASVIRKTNQMIFTDIKKGMFITANYGILNMKTLRFQFVSAGHNDTLVYNSHSGELQAYNPKGIALGLDKGTLFDTLLQDQELILAPGDLLFQYTDGINEAMNDQREEFGEDRLQDMIRKHAHLSVKEFLHALDDEIRAFTGGFAQSDDITAIAIKVKE